MEYYVAHDAVSDRWEVRSLPGDTLVGRCTDYADAVTIAEQALKSWIVLNFLEYLKTDTDIVLAVPETFLGSPLVPSTDDVTMLIAKFLMRMEALGK